MSILESTDDQFEREQRRHVKNFEVGQFVRAILIAGNTKLRIKRILNTELENVKVYELESADHSIYYGTKDFIWSDRADSL